MTAVENINNMTLFAPRMTPPTEESFLQVLQNNMLTPHQHQQTTGTSQTTGPSYQSRSPPSGSKVKSPQNTDTSPTGQTSATTAPGVVYGPHTTENQKGNNTSSAISPAATTQHYVPQGMPASYQYPPTIPPGFINGSFTLVNSGQLTSAAQPLTQHPGYFMPSVYSYPPPVPQYTTHQSAQIHQQPAPSSVEEWKNQKLTHLQSNPLLADLQPALSDKECDADAFGYTYNYTTQMNSCSSTSPDQNQGQKPQVSVTVRASMLKVRLAKLTESLPTQGASLQQVYKQKATQIEKARYAELLAKQTMPWLIHTVNSTYDDQHHAAITSVEQNLEFLERSSGCDVSSTSSKGREGDYYYSKVVENVTQGKYTHRPGFISHEHSVLPDQMISNASKKLLEVWYKKNRHHPYPKSLLGLAREVRTSVHNVRQWLRQREGSDGDREGGASEQSEKAEGQEQQERKVKKQRTE